MRKLIELSEEIDEVNYFLREWQRLKYSSDTKAQLLAEPELRFISRTLERLVNESQALEVPLLLHVDKYDQKKQPSGSTIELSECLRLVNKNGTQISYVGNHKGLLSLSRIAEMIARGSSIKLSESVPSQLMC